jgi:hypothetical protein
MARRDATLATVLALLHEQQAEDRTLAPRAREAHQSHATLARRSAPPVGEPPPASLAR